MRIITAVSSITVFVPSIALLLLAITFLSIAVLTVTQLLVIILIAVVTVPKPSKSVSIFLIAVMRKPLLSRRCLIIVASGLAIGCPISTAHQIAHHSGHTGSRELKVG